MSSSFLWTMGNVPYFSRQARPHRRSRVARRPSDVNRRRKRENRANPTSRVVAVTHAAPLPPPHPRRPPSVIPNVHRWPLLPRRIHFRPRAQGSGHAEPRSRLPLALLQRHAATDRFPRQTVAHPHASAPPQSPPRTLADPHVRCFTQLAYSLVLHTKSGA